MKSMEGKVALITGGSTGIGHATALAFAREGANVVIADVAVEQCNETVQSIVKSGGKALCVQVDVSKADQVESMINQTMQTFGRLDFAFNNAGIEGASAPTAEYPIDSWNRVIAVNLTGVWLCMHFEIPAMLKQGGGAIVNMASILGQVGFANSSAYVGAKHGVIGITQAAALEYAAKGLRVNAVCPGFIETPMLERAGMLSDPELRAMITNLHPIQRMGRPEEIAEPVVFLCSDKASFITGEALAIDGGYLAQ